MSNFDPTAVTVVVGAPGSGSATVSWVQPVNGAPPFYTVQISLNSTNIMGPSVKIAGTVLTAIVTGLLPGELYIASVQTPLGGYSLPSAAFAIPGALIPTFASTPATNVLRKIKAAMAAAAQKNWVDSTPSNPVFGGAAANATAYGPGIAASNGGNTYIALAGANFTSGASTVTGLTGTSQIVVSDGTNNWSYYGPIRTTSSAVGAPTVSVINTAIATTFGASPQTINLNSSLLCLAGGGVLIGGGAINSGSNTAYCVGGFLGVNSAGNFNGTPYNAYSPSTFGYIYLETDAPKIGFSTFSGNFFTGYANVAVDDVLVCDGAISNATQVSGGYLLLDFSASTLGTRKKRKIKVYGNNIQNGTLLSTVFIDVASRIWLPQMPNRYRIVFEGDSLTGGAFAANANAYPLYSGVSWPDKFAALVGCDDYYNMAVGTTGFLNPGPGGIIPYQGRLPWISQQNPDVLIVAGNANDGSFTSTQRQAAVLSWLQFARTLMPNVVIIVFGPWPGNTVSNATLKQQDADMHVAVSAFNDPLTFWYSIMADSASLDALTSVATSWCFGTGYAATAHQTSDGNSDFYTSSLLPHFTQLGSDYAARRYAAAFSTLINSIST